MTTKTTVDFVESLTEGSFDEYIAVIHAIFEGKKRILRCQRCFTPVVKNITNCTADNEQIYQLQKRNSLLCKGCLGFSETELK
jgi:hypothetical protein